MTDITLPREPTPEMLAAMARALCKEAGWDPSWTEGWLMKRLARAAYTALVKHLSDTTD